MQAGFNVRLRLHQGDSPKPIGRTISRSMGRQVVVVTLGRLTAGAPHGLCSTLKDQVNADLLAFIRT